MLDIWLFKKKTSILFYLLKTLVPELASFIPFHPNDHRVASTTNLHITFAILLELQATGFSTITWCSYSSMHDGQIQTEENYLIVTTTFSHAGESIPVRLFLSPYELTPTYRNINNKFSVKYFLNLVLVDEEDRRYFKQQEITVYRLLESWAFWNTNANTMWRKEQHGHRHQLVKYLFSPSKHKGVVFVSSSKGIGL